MYYIITLIVGCFLGIVLASLLSSAKRADEWSEAYNSGFAEGMKCQRKIQILFEDEKRRD